MIDRILASDIFLAFWIFLPAGIANMTPIFASRIPLLNRWNTPLDFGKRWNGKPFFGENKTWRGVTAGTVAGGLTCLLQVAFASEWQLTTAMGITALIVGGMLGTGALLGDAIESFFKRRAHVKPGHSWFPFDQLDYIIGGLVFYYPIVRLPLDIIVWIVVVYFGLHLIASYIGYLLGFKSKPI